MSGTALLIVSGGAVLLIFLLVNLYGTNYQGNRMKELRKFVENNS